MARTIEELESMVYYLDGSVSLLREQVAYIEEDLGWLTEALKDKGNSYKVLQVQHEEIRDNLFMPYREGLDMELILLNEEKRCLQHLVAYADLVARLRGEESYF
jgi:hypothetical protein